MKLLALDQSSRITGWAVFQEDNLIDSGTFTATDDSTGQRLVKIRNEIYKLIDKYDITEVAFEDIQMQTQVNNVTTYKVLAEVFGVVEESLAEKGVSYQVIHSETWKSQLKIKGKTRTEQKKNSQQRVIDVYNKKVSQDEADAINIGSCYILLNKYEVGLF